MFRRVTGEEVVVGWMVSSGVYSGTGNVSFEGRVLETD